MKADSFKQYGLACAMLLVSFLGSTSGQAQGFTIPRYTVGAGGGISTGGVFSVTGTVGQPAVGAPMVGSGFQVTGGIWALPVAVQTTNAPTLTILAARPGEAQISWQPADTAWRLQESPALSPPAWVDSPSGNINPIVVPSTSPAKYYRLTR